MASQLGADRALKRTQILSRLSQQSWKMSSDQRNFNSLQSEPPTALGVVAVEMETLTSVPQNLLHNRGWGLLTSAVAMTI